jgi:hypothetical protein
MQWSDVEPVLIATYRLFADVDQVEGEEVCVTLGRAPDDEATARALRYLSKHDYIDAIHASNGQMAASIRTTERGLQYCAGWPSEGSSPAFMEAFLRAIQERADAEATPEDERGRLRSFLEAARGVPKELFADVAAKLIEGQAGL